MDSLVKSEEFEFSADSPMYDFSTGFDAIPLTYMPDSDTSSIYSYGSSPPSSLSSSPTHTMAVDNNFPPPPRLSNNHRQARFLNRSGWNVGDNAQRPTFSPAPRPYGASVRACCSIVVPDPSLFPLPCPCCSLFSCPLCSVAFSESRSMHCAPGPRVSESVQAQCLTLKLAQ